MLDGSALAVFAAFSLGLLGAGHCISMCGGIACALGMGVGQQRAHSPPHRWICLAGYQIGRVLSYTLAGAVAGGAARMVALPLESAGARSMLHLFQAVLFLLLGLYLTGVWRAPLSALEGVGLRVWNRLTPLRRKLLPVRHPLQALAFGLLWGWLPCALVYSAVALAVSSGSGPGGAMSMFAFGLGTVPAMLAASVFGRKLLALSVDGWLRKGLGILMLVAGAGLGVISVVHA